MDEKQWKGGQQKFCVDTLIMLDIFRDRPFNLKGGGLWFFVSFRIFFSDNTRIRIFFFVAQSATFFLQNSTLDYMTKTLNHIIFFFLYQNLNIFFSNIGNQNIFLEKKHNPPFKLNGRSLISLYNEESLKLD
jgi:hypothetical protein